MLTWVSLTVVHGEMAHSLSARCRKRTSPKRIFAEQKELKICQFSHCMKTQKTGFQQQQQNLGFLEKHWTCSTYVLIQQLLNDSPCLINILLSQPFLSHTEPNDLDSTRRRTRDEETLRPVNVFTKLFGLTICGLLVVILKNHLQNKLFKTCPT